MNIDYSFDNNVNFNDQITHFNTFWSTSTGTRVNSHFLDASYQEQDKNFQNEYQNYKKDIVQSDQMLKDAYHEQSKMNSLNDKHESKNDIRQIQFNNYNALKYNTESAILKQIIFFCCIAIAGSFLFINGFINETIYIIYLSCVLLLGCFSILYQLYNLFIKDRNNFDENDYSFILAPGNDVSNDKIIIPSQVTKKSDKCE